GARIPRASIPWQSAQRARNAPLPARIASGLPSKGFFGGRSWAVMPASAQTEKRVIARSERTWVMGDSSTRIPRVDRRAPLYLPPLVYSSGLNVLARAAAGADRLERCAFAVADRRCGRASRTR